MTDNEDKTELRKLTLYLLQEGQTPETVLKPEYLTLLKSHPNHDPRIRIVYGRREGKFPEWKDAYEMSEEEANDLISPRPYGIIFVHFNGNANNEEDESMEISSDDVSSQNQTIQRWMVVTHGCGRELLDLNKMEQRFGLIFTLNSVDLITLTSSKSLTIAKQHNITDYHPKGADITQFYMLELLKGMRGKEFELPVDGLINKQSNDLMKDPPKKRDVKISMEGNNVLKIKFWGKKGVSINELPDICKSYYGKFQEDTYKKRYPSLRNFLPVYDINIIEVLEKKLVESIKNLMENENDFDSLDLTYPWTEKPIDCKKVKYRNFKNGEGSRKDYKLSILTYLGKISANAEEKEIFRTGTTEHVFSRLKHHVVHFITSNKRKKNEDSKCNWPVKNCIIYDTEFQENRYIFIDSSWYLMDPEYIRTIKKNFEDKCLPSTLPPYEEQCSELLYNTFACREKDYLLLDNKSVIIGNDNRNQFEFGDILTKEAKLYHVKKYGPISEFGFVFQQLEISADLIQNDKKVYNDVYEMVKKEEALYNENKNQKGEKFVEAVKTIKYDPPNATYCVAVIAKESTMKLGLTLQSLIVFYNTTKVLEKHGYKVAFEWIVDSTHKKKKKNQTKITQFFDTSTQTDNIIHKNAESFNLIPNDSSTLDTTTRTLSCLNISKTQNMPKISRSSNTVSETGTSLSSSSSNKVDEPPSKKTRPGISKKKRSHSRKKNKKNKKRNLQ